MSAAAMRPVEEANVWETSDFAGPRAWVRTLSPAMIAEIADAVGAAAERGMPCREITRETCPLPLTKALLSEAYDDLENGRGFTVVAGWPVDEHDRDANTAALCAVGAHFGDIVVQNYEGETIVDVTDKDVPYTHRSRGYGSNKLLPFHTDGADVVGLLCVGAAAQGGASVLASATHVYNTILAERPQYLETLLRGFYHHRRGQHDAGENPLSPRRIPVFAFHGGYLHCCYNRNPIDWAEKEGVRLSDHEKEVLDYFDAVIGRDGMRIRMDMQKGDMQFLNNFVILHSRDGYTDDAAHKRHLLRLWLANPASKRNGESLLDLYVPATSRFAKAR